MDLRASWWTVSLYVVIVAMPAPAVADAPRDLGDYVVLGINDVRLRDGAFIASGDVGVNEAAGGVEIDRRVFIGNGSATVADHARLGSATSLFDLFTNDLSAAPSIIRGAGPLAFTPPIATVLPPLPKFAPGTTAVVVRRDDVQTLAPGQYGLAVVEDHGTLELSGGTYQLLDLIVGKSAKVFVRAPSVLNVQGIVDIGRFAGFGPGSSALSARDVVVNVGGPFVGFASAGHVEIDLFAPNAAVRFDQSFRGRGRFIGATITIGRTTNFRRVHCNGPGTSGCGDRAPAPAPSTFCTLGQAIYGSTVGGANGPIGLVTLHPGLLPLTVGAPGILSLSVPRQSDLVCFLPATGDPAALCSTRECSGDMTVSACAKPPLIDFVPTGDGSSGGQGGGTLTGQTIAAKLNVALSRLGVTPRGLGTLLLPETLCTTKCPRGREIDPITMTHQASAAGIADGFTSVDDLVALADQALSQGCRTGTCDRTDRNAFVPPDPIRLSSIATALAAVNECFQGCATIVPCQN